MRGRRRGCSQGVRRVGHPPHLDKDHDDVAAVAAGDLLRLACAGGIWMRRGPCARRRRSRLPGVGADGGYVQRMEERSLFYSFMNKIIINMFHLCMKCWID
jgi:hypothetical protein